MRERGGQDTGPGCREAGRRRREGAQGTWKEFWKGRKVCVWTEGKKEEFDCVMIPSASTKSGKILSVT